MTLCTQLPSPPLTCFACTQICTNPLIWECLGLDVHGLTDGETCEYTFLQCVFRPLQHFLYSPSRLHALIL